MSGDGGTGESEKKDKRKLVTLTIDGREVKASDRATILDVARREGIFVPTLCYDQRLAPFGACRVCMVGVAGARGPLASCTTLVREGMVVDTKDETATRVAKSVVESVALEHAALTITVTARIADSERKSRMSVPLTAVAELRVEASRE